MLKKNPTKNSPLNNGASCEHTQKNKMHSAILNAQFLLLWILWILDHILIKYSWIVSVDMNPTQMQTGHKSVLGKVHLPYLCRKMFTGGLFVHYV
jgi:hypothetical protein